LQSLSSTPVSRRVGVRQPVIKINAESLSQHDEKHVVPTPLSGIRGKKKKKCDLHGWFAFLHPLKKYL
jgi:hypothetical protein